MADEPKPAGAERAPEPESEPARRWWRWPWRVFAGAVVAGCAGLVGLNLFLVTPAGRGWVAEKLGGALGLPVDVGAASYTPWGGARVRDIRVEPSDAARAIVDRPFFSAASFEADIDLLALMRREVVVRRLVCESPSLMLVRGQGIAAGAGRARDGGGGPPLTGGGAAGEGAAPGPDAAGPSQAPQGGAATPAGQRGATGDGVAVARGPGPARRPVSLGEVEVRGGSVRIASHAGAELLAADGMRLVLDLEGGGGGRIAFDRVVVVSELEVLALESPVEIAGGWVHLNGLRGRCEGGAVGGQLSLKPGGAGKPFSALLNVKGAEVAGVLGEGARAVGLASGKVSAEVALRGHVSQLERAQGTGTLRVESARLLAGEDGAGLRDALEVDRGGGVALEAAEARIVLQRGILGIDEASFGSGRVLVKARGGVRSGDGAVNVAVRLYLWDDLRAALHPRGRPPLEFARLAGTDWFYRDDVITGTLADPRVDFWRTGEPVGVGEVVRELTAGSAGEPVAAAAGGGGAPGERTHPVAR